MGVHRLHRLYMHELSMDGSEHVPRAKVQRDLAKYVRVPLYTEGAGELYERQQEMEKNCFGTVAPPYYARVDTDGNSRATFPGLTRNTAGFVGFLEKGVTD